MADVASLESSVPSTTCDGALAAPPAPSAPPAPLAPAAATSLSQWEAARSAHHALRSGRVDEVLGALHLRAKGALRSLDAWSGILESRRKLQEVAATASSHALGEVEARWKRDRWDDSDGEAAAWLIAAEQAHAAALAARAPFWAAAVPQGLEGLRRRYTAFAKRASEVSPPKLHDWDTAHGACLRDWSCHLEHLNSVTLHHDRPPPDAWLSEVRYRENARVYVTAQADAESMVAGLVGELRVLEVERVKIWQEVSSSYRQVASFGDGLATPVSDAPQDAHEDWFGTAVKVAAICPPPEVRLCVGEADVWEPFPEMPKAHAAVLHRIGVSAPIPAGFLGFGGGGWREGFSLVLTVHGYMHLFNTPDEQELVESAIVASVYVPSVTRCVFIRRGAECTADLAEAEALEQAAAKPSYVDKAREFMRRSASELPRRVQARLPVADSEGLERHCHQFVRRGQEMRSAASKNVKVDE